MRALNVTLNKSKLLVVIPTDLYITLDQAISAIFDWSFFGIGTREEAIAMLQLTSNVATSKEFEEK